MRGIVLAAVLLLAIGAPQAWGARPAVMATFPTALIEVDPAWLASPTGSDGEAWRGHFDAWARAGVNGFCVPCLWGTPVPITTPDSLADVARTSGLDTWFARMTLPTDQSWFTDPEAATTVLDTLAGTTQTLPVSGYRGIVLSADASAGFFSVWWEGHRPGSGSPETLFRGARRFGTDLGRAFTTEAGDTDLLLLTSDLTMAQPLWFPFFAGVIEGAESRTRGVHLIIRPQHLRVTPTEAGDLILRNRNRLDSALDGRARTVWERIGSIGLDTAFPGSNGANDAVLDWFGARVYADRYLIGTAPEEAFQLKAVPIPEPPSLLLPDPEPPKLLPRPLIEALDGMSRLAPHPDPAIPAYVLAHDRGTAVLFWRGCPEVIRTQGLLTALPVTDLTTSVRTFHEPSDGETEVGPFSGPTLVERLPVKEWAMPACLWFEADPMLPDGVLPVRFGLLNPAPVGIEGTLTARGSRQVSISPASIPIALGPGEAASVSGTLRGDLTPGIPQTIELNLVTREGGLIIRTETFVPIDSVLWQHTLHGPVTGLLTVEHDGQILAIATSDSGDVYACNVQGDVVWQTGIDHPLAGPPTRFRHWTGEPRIALCDTEGRIHLLALNGEDRGMVHVGDSVSARSLSAVRLHRFPGDELVGVFNENTVQAILSNGQALWAYEPDGGVAGFIPADADGDGYDELFIAGDVLTCLHRSGDWQWRVPLPGGASCTPVAADLLGDGQIQILTGSGKGHLQIRDTLWGLPMGEVKTNGPVLHLHTADLDNQPGLEILAISSHSLTAFTADLVPLWEAPVTCGPVPPVVITEPGRSCILVTETDGKLTLFDSNGHVLRTDNRYAAPLTATILIPQATVGLLGSADGTLTALPLP